ncbi:MAG TPA: PQ-loop domain-containing transporter [Candidatus Goldiibacteriota bacterium]|nr:PQ-loop domain-containing transporter [Candidatus Goldiibacteriota bacterium]
MKLVTLLGFAAAAISTSGFLPQVIKGFVTRKMDDVALWQPILLTTGMTLWLIYGVLLAEMPIIVANSIAIAFNLIIIGQKLAYSVK